MTITGQSALGKDQIDQMVRDAEAHAEEDRRRKEEVDVRNSADTLAYQTEKLLKEQADKISEEERKGVEDRLGELRKALEGSDLEAIRSATEALMTASQEFTQKLYQQASASQAGPDGAGAAGAAGASAPDDDEVVDAEIVDEDDEK